VIDLLLLALVFPLVGFAAGGAPFSLHPWITPAALVVPSLAFLLAIRPTASAGPELRHGGRRIRLMTLGLVLCGLAGVVIAGALFPGSSELRLLAISPAIVVAFTAPATLLHPSPEDGRRLAEILVPVSYLAMIAGMVLLYAMA
jgi:hypothetical protein